MPPGQGAGPWNVSSPWQQGPSTQTGPQFPDATRRGPDPNAPIGRDVPDPNNIANYAAPRRRWPWWFAGGAMVVVILAIIVYQIVPTPTGPQETASPTASATASIPEGATEYESEEDNATGYWRVTDTEWGVGTVDVEIEITGQTGTMPFSFFALGHSADEAVDAQKSTHTPSLEWGGTISTGKTEKGWVQFSVVKEKTTVILATNSSSAVSAIEINP